MDRLESVIAFFERWLSVNLFDAGNTCHCKSFLSRSSLLHSNAHSGVHGDEHLRSSLGTCWPFRSPFAHYDGSLKRLSWLHDNSQPHLAVARLCVAEPITRIRTYSPHLHVLYRPNLVSENAVGPSTLGRRKLAKGQRVDPSSPDVHPADSSTWT